MIFSENCRILLLLILLLLLRILVSTWGANSEIFDLRLHWCQNLRISNTSSLTIEVSSEKVLEFQLLMRATIRRLSQSFIHFLVSFKGRSLAFSKRIAWFWLVFWLGSGEVSCVYIAHTNNIYDLNLSHLCCSAYLQASCLLGLFSLLFL